MNLLKTSLLAMVLFCTVTSCSKDTEVVVEETTDYTIDLNLANETDWEMANEILDLINQHRSSQGLALLKSDQQYASAYAVDHTLYMIDLEEINHDHFDVRKKALKKRGAKIVGENVAFGYPTAEEVVNAWLNSEGHRQNIEGDFTHSGFGVIEAPDGRVYFTQLFYKK
ncbi:CAP domain-containing protein [Marixanthomonas spongiae]|uniref:CAP domain-containing protein n=1 Tax=Marixanthomonas spongiae TaxID=2174845 RepID=A0A2U0I2B9_9FLAO|nr:CAP domain-containing protein [Marixanthomonas spongiae]PVW15262.1 CAP domain-containing protein [Marixanthomonas spongiae]